MKISDYKPQVHAALHEPGTRYFVPVNGAIGIMALVSVLLALTELDPSLARYEPVLVKLDVLTTAFFTTEYVLRLWITDQKWKYAISPLGIIDLFSFVPTYLGLGNFGFLKAARFIRIARLSRVANLSNVPKVVPKRKRK